MKTLRHLLPIIALACFVMNAIGEEKQLPPCCRKPLPASPASDQSLYLLESKWTSDFGKSVPLSQFRGRIQILGMFFSQCEYACPILLGHIKKVEAALPEHLKGNVDFLLISFDSARDSVKVLADYRVKNQLSPDHWTLLRGEEDDVRELAALLGINYQRDVRGQFAHTNLITILNPEGEVAFQQTGLDSATEQIIAALQKINPQR